MNDQLQTYLKVTDEDEILLQSPESLKSFAAALESIDKGFALVTLKASIRL